MVTISIVFPGNVSVHNFRSTDTFLSVYNFASRECRRIYWFDRAIQIKDLISVSGMSVLTQIQKMLRHREFVHISVLHNVSLFPVFKDGSRIPEPILSTTEASELVDQVFPKVFQVSAVDGFWPRGTVFTLRPDWKCVLTDKSPLFC